MRVRLAWLALLTLVLALVGCRQERSQSFLALGDSYTVGQGVSESDRWPMGLVEHWRARGEKWSDPQYVATTGWTTEDLLNGTKGANFYPPYDRVSVLIGANDVNQKVAIDDYRFRFDMVLTEAIKLVNNESSRVFVVSIPDFGATPFGQSGDPEEISKTVGEFNSAARDICKTHNVRFVDITAMTRRNDPGWIIADGLHPSSRQYEAWVAQLAQEIP